MESWSGRMPIENLAEAVAHNPTGVDPTQEQWQKIVAACKERSSEWVLWTEPFYDPMLTKYSKGGKRV